MKLFTRNFTLLILGQASSLLGNGTLRFAVSMYVLDITGSAGTYSLIVALSMLPMIVLSPLGGVLADRADRRRIMVALDALSGAAVLLGAQGLSLGGNVASVGTLLMALGALAAFESPTVQACVPQMLSGESVLRGNAAVSQVQAVTSLVTPFLGAAAYSAFGLGGVMLAAAACFFLTALLECFIRLGYPPRGAKGGAISTVRDDLAESARFLRREQPDVLKLLLLSGAVSIFLAGVMVVGYPSSCAHDAGTLVGALQRGRERGGRSCHIGQRGCGFHVCARRGLDAAYAGCVRRRGARGRGGICIGPGRGICRARGSVQPGQSGVQRVFCLCDDGHTAPHTGELDG